MKRTNYAGRTSEEQIGQEVVVKGWVAKRRNLGGLIFIDLWDREGIVQLVFNEEEDQAAFEVANQARNQYILEARGLVRAWPKSTRTLRPGRLKLRLRKLRSWPSPRPRRLKSKTTSTPPKTCA